ncbi:MULTISPECIES: LytR/AlgR family response regulator transcription factor [Paenibacillus]|uniref:LytR/AlgR family response regulator transcription factor n=1 Tax=Paenibacillus TaxID=44249 RepID=UPI00096C77E9|nr:LytTR family DNA-binding domain-containing protein [Paenibacillus odorifer]
MIRIAVCDDDFPTTELIERLILETQRNFTRKIEVSIFYSGESFTKAIQEACTFDIIFMDIEMAGMDGIKAGYVLRGNDENDLVQLIYVSSHDEYHLQLFDVQPSGFIKKPIDSEIFKQKLISTIEKVIRKLQQGKKNFLSLQQKGKEILIPYRNIIYLESNRRRIILYSCNDQLGYYSTLNEEEQRLPVSDFVRIHQSYIVNFYFIKEISNQGVILLNGEALPISAKYSADFKKKYLKFRGSLVG